MSTVSNNQGVNPSGRGTLSRNVSVAYWLLTLLIALSTLGSGVMAILHLPPFYGILLHLGYPPYFATLLGVWTVLGALVLLAPRHPLLKEWVYAGMFFQFSSALISHLAVGDGAVWFLGPIVLIGALAGSWHLRPHSRRLMLPKGGV
jgi:hypothetical protein